MNDPTAFPLALAQANYELQARIAELARSGGQYWYEFVQRLVNDGIVESSAELQEILHARDWQQLLSTTPETYWRQLQQGLGDQQTAMQIAVAAQAAFARGVQDALAAWQHDTVAALDQAGLATPALDPDWAGMLSGWDALLPEVAVTYSLQPVATRAPAKKKAATRKTTAEKKAPASATAKKAGKAKKAPVGKAATRKAAAKKPAAKKATAKKAAKAPARKTAKKAGKRR